MTATTLRGLGDGDRRGRVGVRGAAHADSAPVDLQVVDREAGQPLRAWRHDGYLFVAGAPGDRYGLRVANNTDGRVLVVMSVDGVNILSGETAGYDQRDYVFGPHESYDQNGSSQVALARQPQAISAFAGPSSFGGDANGQARP